MFTKLPMPIIITGPTASGKSFLALELAKRIEGCIINADSGQLYDGLSILTAQPTLSDKQQIPHVLYGAWPLNENANAPLWAEKATIEIQNTFLRGRQPILVGGTGLYLKTLLEGFPVIPNIPKEIREEAILKRDKIGAIAFFDELKNKDFTLNSHLRAEDSQRVIRAWEVLEFTGKSLAWWQKQTPVAYIDKAIVICLLPPKEILNKNIQGRFQCMLQQGVIEEVKNFLDLKLASTCNAMKAIGLKEIKSYLNGDISLEILEELIVIATRQYAKRQRTWFRHQLTPDIIYTSIPDSLEHLLQFLKEQ